MVLELLHEIGAEISAKPTTFIIEVVQFLVLLAIIWVIAFGIGKRRGFLSNMLVERRDRVERDLGEASSAGAALALAQERAQTSLEEARAESKRNIAAARRAARDERARAEESAEHEAEALRTHARQLLEMEHSEMLAEARERLLEVVGSATRHILSERLSPAEQRALVQRAIMASLNGTGTPERAEAKTA